MAVDRLAELQEAASKLPQKIAEPLVETPEPEPPKKAGKKTKKSKKGRAASEPPPPPPVPKDPLKIDEFLKQVSKIEDDLQKIEKNCDGVDLAHQSIMNTVSEEDIKLQEAIIGSLMNSTNRLSTSVREVLRSMDEETQVLAPLAPKGSGDLRMRKVKHAALLQKFSSLMKRFQEIQQQASSKHQSKIQRQPDADQEELDDVTGMVGAMTLTSQQIFSLGQSRDPLETLERLKSRRKDVMNIEKGIVTLNQLFVDLNNMIEEQGAILDNLENYLGETVAYTEEAEKTMSEAVETQRNIRKLHCSVV